MYYVNMGSSKFRILALTPLVMAVNQMITQTYNKYSEKITGQLLTKSAQRSFFFCYRK
jgi:hypothetical protein